MVTIHRNIRARLYLKEHRKAKKVSATEMADRLAIERESVHRVERRNDPKYQTLYAAALGIENPEELWRPPGTTSLDALVAGEPQDFKDMAADLLRRMLTNWRQSTK
jgi:transcriptional regulator with XRE-family HTH domain